MVSRIIEFSLNNKLIVLLGVLGLVLFSIYASLNISIGAVPDITNNQVQVITTSRNLATEDVETFITQQVELEMANLPGVKEIRSISKFGLSVVTIVFEDDMGSYLTRQLIAEKIKHAEERIPQGFGTPYMGPISTGLGEIYQYILDVKPGYEDTYSVMDLRSIQDWIVKRQLSGIPGIVEINTWGGLLKTYEVSVDPYRLKAMNISIGQVFKALENGNELAGGGYIEKGHEAYFIRAEGLARSLDDIREIVVDLREGVPILIGDIGEVGFGHATRFGAITGNGEGEKVLGQIMMLKGASSYEVITEVKKKIDEIQHTLPEGVYINPFLERSELINKTTSTIAENLILGCLIVVFVVILLLGNFRTALIIASVIPLCLMFAISMMYVFGIDANLMSLGAIDFGIIIDGAVIIAEFIAYRISQESPRFVGLDTSASQSLIDKITLEGSQKMMRSAVFGQIIIIIVFIPVLSLVNVEGKMFRPMAMTFCFALIGAMILCFTYIPVVASLLLKPTLKSETSIAGKIMDYLYRIYQPSLKIALRSKKAVLGFALFLLILAGVLFMRMGGEFVPTLDEGDFVIQPILKTGLSLSETIAMTTRIEKILGEFSEVDQVVSRIGAAEVPTDPMSMEESDVIIKLNPIKEWQNAKSKDELADLFKDAIEMEIPDIEIEFTQPIEMRFNELITGVRTDLAIKVFGEDLDLLYTKALEIREAIAGVEGASDVVVEKTSGLPQMKVRYDRSKISRYGLNINDLNEVVSMGFAGQKAGIILEGERQFDLMVKYDPRQRKSIEDLREALVSLPNGKQIPLSEFAEISYTKGPAKISRDDTKRRIVVGVNVRGRDLVSVVDEVKQIIDTEIELPPGYLVQYGGQFENLEKATQRLQLAVPIALVLILILLYFAFDSMKDALMIYSAIPLASLGGIFLLYMRSMPFSISAGVGFIALFGIAVLNGIVLIEHFNTLKNQEMDDIYERVIRGTRERLRPVILTASAAALGFLPMALSTSAGAEVQRPLATVVIGGLISATLLTLIVLPVLYVVFNKRPNRSKSLPLVLLVILAPFIGNSQTQLSLEQALDIAAKNNYEIQSSQLQADHYQAMIGTAGKKENTEFYYQFDQNNISEDGRLIHVIGLNQSFKLPSFHKSNTEWKEAQFEVASQRVLLTNREIEKLVTEGYYDIVHWKWLYQEYDYLQQLYANIADKMDERFRLGDIGQIETNVASLNISKFESLKYQAEYGIQEAQLTLQNLLQTTDSIDAQEKNIERVSMETSGEAYHPILDVLEKEMSAKKAEAKFQAKQKLPNINLSVFSGVNFADGKNWYPGLYAGIELPLWRKSYKAGDQAAQLAIAQSELNLYKNEAHIANLHTIAKLNVLRLHKAIDQYEQINQPLEEKMISSAQISFELGEIDFFHYQKILETATNIRIQYIHDLIAYNEAVINLKFLSN